MESQTDHAEEFVVPGRSSQDLWRSHFERYRFAADLTPGKKILDLACGSGYGSDYLAEHDAKRVVGGDVSTEALTYATRHFVRPNLSFVKLNAVCLPFPPCSFDAVVSFETVEHVRDSDEFLRECARVLRPEGVFLCSTPMRFAWRPPWVPEPLNPFHAREFSLAELRDAIGDHFDDVQLFGQACTRFDGVLARYVAFSSGLLLSFLPRAGSLSHRARDALLGLRPEKPRKPSGKGRDLFAVRPLPGVLPGFPGVVIAKAGRRA